jgi:hypothetical protein
VQRRFATLGLKGLRWVWSCLLLVADAAQVAGIWLALLAALATLAHLSPVVAVAAVEDLEHATGLGAACGLCLDCAAPCLSRYGCDGVAVSVGRQPRTDCGRHWLNGYRHDDPNGSGPYGSQTGRRENGSCLLHTGGRRCGGSRFRVHG